MGKMDKSVIEKLMIRLIDGDDTAFNEIYALTSKQVFAVIFGIVKDQSLANDLTQDTFIKIKKSIGQYKPGSNGFAWILTIARNMALNEYRKRKHEVYVDFAAEEYKYGHYEMETKETPTLDLAKKILRENEFEVLTLHLMSDMKHKDIAKQLDKPLGTVLWLYNNALQKLKKALKEENK